MPADCDNLDQIARHDPDIESMSLADIIIIMAWADGKVSTHQASRAIRVSVCGLKSRHKKLVDLGTLFSSEMAHRRVDEFLNRAI